MPDEDPFAEPDDTDRTVVRPNPGGRLSGVATPRAAQLDRPKAPPQREPDEVQQPASERSDVSLTAGMTGLNPLNAAAATLFSLISRIRNRAQHPDPEALRRSVVAEIRAFESRALQEGFDARQIKVARYAICATIDDVVLNTPWGGNSVWAQRSMVDTFHRETVGGDRFYDLLSRLEQYPSNNIDLLEFLYVCLSLGFEGRLRVQSRGQERHQEVRAGLARLIRSHRGELEHDLSPHWQGVDRRHRALSLWRPVWIAVGSVAAILTATFLAFTFALGNSTGQLIGQLAAIESGGVVRLDRPAQQVDQPETKDPQIERVSGFLTEEIEEGIVEVFPRGNTITIRLTGAGMFSSGSATLSERFLTPLSRVADALKDTDGPVIVVGYTDSIPIRTARFPSNTALSLARAQTVTDRVAGELDDPSRLRAEGRADKDPVASNQTPEGRAQNRRIEIVLVRRDSP